MGWSGFRNRKEGPQQGTLFDVREAPSQPVNSPGMQKRGRRAEMMAALPEVHVSAGADSYDEVRGKIEQRRGSGNPTSYTPGTRAEAIEKSGLAERADLARKIGNETTLTPEHISGIDRMSVGRPLPGGGAEYRAAKLSTGPEINFSEPPSPSTIAHEVGHHMSMGKTGNRVTADTQMARLASGTTIWPAEEARADAFMHQHTRNHPEKSYAKLKGFAEQTEYGGEREARGVPLTPQEREWQGLPGRVLQPDLFGRG